MNGRFWHLGKKSTLLLSAVTLLAFVVAGCGTAAGVPQGAAPAAKHKPVVTVQIQLNWLTNVEFSGLWMADHFGWFKKAGFKLQAKAWANGINPETTTASCWQSAGKNKLCLGFDDSSAIPIARQAGNNLVGIWAGSQKTPFGFMSCFVPKKPKVNKKCKSNTGKNITNPRQWKGLTVGYQSHELYVPQIMLSSVGLNLGQVTPHNAAFNIGELTSGVVDVYEVFINNEPIAEKLSGIKVNVIPAYKWGMASFYADVMFAPQSEIGARKSKLKAFVKLVDRGWKWAMAHPKKAADIVEKDYFKATTPSVAFNRKQQEMEEGVFAKTLSRQGGKVDGQMTLARWKQIIKVLRKSKTDGGTPILSKNVPAKDCFTNQFTPAPGGAI
ncbi:MAG TPA: ABC transporter substrate-binding protein [Chloroflexota bacterium]|nr:ABC transporter substrate-binding protein [Chloroflexota bacterium]